MKREQIVSKFASIEAEVTRKYVWDRAFSSPKDSKFGDWRYLTDHIEGTVSPDKFNKYPKDALIEAGIHCRTLAIEVSYKEWYWSKASFRAAKETARKDYIAYLINMEKDDVCVSPYQVGCSALKSYLEGNIEWNQFVTLITTSCDL